MRIEGVRMIETSENDLPVLWRWSCDLILVATDGSPSNLHAIGWAARIAEAVPAELLTVYAYEPAREGRGVDAQTAAQSQVERWCAHFGATGVSMRSAARAGDLRTIIRDEIGASKPDLVIVGSHGTNGFPGVEVGSIGDWMAHLSTYPLGVVPAGARVRTGGPIFVGVDGSAHSDRALHWALGMAGRLQRPVHAIYGAASFEGAEPDGQVSGVERQVEQAQSHASAMHVDLDLRVEPWEAAKTLAAQARDDDAELMVVGVRGHGVDGQLTIGGVPRRLLALATRPVVIVGG
jgi:nucleotide-binding universal stress UspA family protein